MPNDFDGDLHPNAITGVGIAVALVLFLIGGLVACSLGGIIAALGLVAGGR